MMRGLYMRSARPPSLTTMMRLRCPIMFAAMPTHESACAARVSRRSCPTAASSGPASTLGIRSAIGEVTMGLIIGAP